jgi:hypothetical protein
MTLSIKNKKVKLKPIKDKDGNAGYFIPREEWKLIKKYIPSSGTRKKSKPSVYPDVKEAIEEMGLILRGKLPSVDAKTWIKSL